MDDNDKTADNTRSAKTEEKGDTDASVEESSVGEVGVCEEVKWKPFTVGELYDIASRAAFFAGEGGHFWRRGHRDLAQAAHHLELMERRQVPRLCEVYGCENPAYRTVNGILVPATEDAPGVVGNVPICKPCYEKIGYGGKAETPE